MRKIKRFFKMHGRRLAKAAAAAASILLLSPVRVLAAGDVQGQPDRQRHREPDPGCDDLADGAGSRHGGASDYLLLHQAVSKR